MKNLKKEFKLDVKAKKANQCDNSFSNVLHDSLVSLRYPQKRENSITRVKDEKVTPTKPDFKVENDISAVASTLKAFPLAGNFENDTQVRRFFGISRRRARFRSSKPN